MVVEQAKLDQAARKLAEEITRKELETQKITSERLKVQKESAQVAEALKVKEELFKALKSVKFQGVRISTAAKAVNIERKKFERILESNNNNTLVSMDSIVMPSMGRPKKVDDILIKRTFRQRRLYIGLDNGAAMFTCR